MHPITIDDRIEAVLASDGSGALLRERGSGRSVVFLSQAQVRQMVRLPDPTSDPQPTDAPTAPAPVPAAQPDPAAPPPIDAAPTPPATKPTKGKTRKANP